MIFTLNSKVILTDMQPATRQAVKQRLTMPNPKFAEAKKMGRATWNIKPELKFFEAAPDGVICPRGAASQIYFLCQHHGESIQVDDQRRSLDPVDFEFQGELRPLQAPAVKTVLSKDSGLLSCPTGGGKTVMGTYIIAERRQPALVVVHTRELLNQWISSIEKFLDIPRAEIGIIGGGKFRIGERVTVTTVQSIYKRVQEVTPHIGHVVVDECHRAPSRTFAKAVNAFDARYRLGLTATPWRRDGLSKVIFWHIGDVTGQIHKDDLLDNGNLCQAEVQWIRTDFSTRTDASEKYARALSELTQDDQRNRLVCQTVAANNASGIALVLSDRKDHCNALREILEQEHGIQAGVLTGATPAKERERLVDDLKRGTCRHLVATGQLIGEGFDLPGITSVFLSTPVKFSGRLIQYIGRALRPAEEKDRARIFDFVDSRNPIFNASAKARSRTYQEQQIQNAA